MKSSCCFFQSFFLGFALSCRCLPFATYFSASVPFVLIFTGSNTLRFLDLALDLAQMVSCFSIRSGAKFRPQILQLSRPGTGLEGRGAVFVVAAAAVTLGLGARVGLLDAGRGVALKLLTCVIGGPSMRALLFELAFLLKPESMSSSSGGGEFLTGFCFLGGG